jgi:lysozyme family protein
VARFEPAVEVTLRREGQFVDDPDDPGGATNWGISLRFLRDTLHRKTVTAEDVRKLTKTEAVAIYRLHWWERYGYGDFISQHVATKVFDTAVNIGPLEAHKLLQRSLNAISGGLVVDGIIGPRTRTAANLAEPERLLAKYCALQSDYYCGLAAAKPVLRKFLRGWLHRAAWPLGQGGDLA